MLRASTDFAFRMSNKLLSARATSDKSTSSFCYEIISSMPGAST